ncbi:MAG: cyclic nucleotide-binding protein [Verrucomicrobiaceae bacterium]|nr:cyclic nucleotide-binding protein [Verrucomicrobiaceae bacterium]
MNLTRSVKSLLIPISGLLFVFFILLGLIFIFVPDNIDNFLSMQNLKTILKQTVIVGIGALAMTMIIVSGGIDLSAGSVVALTAVFCAHAVNWLEGDVMFLGIIPIPVLLSILVGALIGFANGTISARLNIAPFIVTLGMMLIARGLAEGFADQSVVRTPDNFLKTLMMREPNYEWLIFAPGVWVNFILFLLTMLIMRASVFGRYIYALGANEDAAKYSGINIVNYKIMIFTLGGAMFGLAGVMSYAEIGDGDPTTAVALELDIIAAVVIGGASLSGGRGSALGSTIGALIITLLYNGCVMLRVDDWVQKVLIGGIIVAAVWVDGMRTKSFSSYS